MPPQESTQNQESAEPAGGSMMITAVDP